MKKMFRGATALVMCLLLLIPMPVYADKKAQTKDGSTFLIICGNGDLNLLCHIDKNSVVVTQLPLGCYLDDQSGDDRLEATYMSFGIRPKFYITVGLKTFSTLVDAIGKISIKLPDEKVIEADGKRVADILEGAGDNAEMYESVIVGFFTSVKKNITPARAVMLVVSSIRDISCSASKSELASLVWMSLTGASKGAKYLRCDDIVSARDIISREF